MAPFHRFGYRTSCSPHVHRDPARLQNVPFVIRAFRPIYRKSSRRCGTPSNGEIVEIRPVSAQRGRTADSLQLECAVTTQGRSLASPVASGASRVASSAQRSPASLCDYRHNLTLQFLPAPSLGRSGLAREKWRAPTGEPGGVLWETGTGRRRSSGAKRCGWH
jgi:hypothetical protein